MLLTTYMKNNVANQNLKKRIFTITGTFVFLAACVGIAIGVYSCSYNNNHYAGTISFVTGSLPNNVTYVTTGGTPTIVEESYPADNHVLFTNVGQGIRITNFDKRSIPLTFYVSINSIKANATRPFVSEASTNEFRLEGYSIDNSLVETINFSLTKESPLDIYEVKLTKTSSVTYQIIYQAFYTTLVSEGNYQECNVGINFVTASM